MIVIPNQGLQRGNYPGVDQIPPEKFNQALTDLFHRVLDKMKDCEGFAKPQGELHQAEIEKWFKDETTRTILKQIKSLGFYYNEMPIIHPNIVDLTDLEESELKNIFAKQVDLGNYPTTDAILHSNQKRKLSQSDLIDALFMTIAHGDIELRELLLSEMSHKCLSEAIDIAISGHNVTVEEGKKVFETLLNSGRLENFTPEEKSAFLRLARGVNRFAVVEALTKAPGPGYKDNSCCII
jgi:hypothetical protein